MQVTYFTLIVFMGLFLPLLERSGQQIKLETKKQQVGLELGRTTGELASLDARSKR